MSLIPFIKKNKNIWYQQTPLRQFRGRVSGYQGRLPIPIIFKEYFEMEIHPMHLKNNKTSFASSVEVPSSRGQRQADREEKKTRRYKQPLWFVVVLKSFVPNPDPMFPSCEGLAVRYVSHFHTFPKTYRTIGRIPIWVKFERITLSKLNTQSFSGLSMKINKEILKIFQIKTTDWGLLLLTTSDGRGLECRQSR